MNATTERLERTTLMLASDVNAWLDRQRAAMRAKTGTCMSRSELLRAMVRATADLAEVDFSNCRTPEDIGMVMFCGDISEETKAAQGRD